MQYFSGQGTVFAAIRDSNGNPTGGFLPLGNCSSLKLALGKNWVGDAAGGTSTPTPLVRSSDPPSFTATVETFSASNMATFLYGKNTPVAGATVTETVITTAGMSTLLSNINLLSFTGLGTYVQGVDYTVNLAAGMINVPLGSPAVGSHSATYISGGYSQIGLGTMIPPYVWLRFAGLNTANSNSPVVIDLFKTRLYPVEALDLIGDTLAVLNVQGRIFKDTDTTAGTANFPATDLTTGQLMRIRQA